MRPSSLLLPLLLTCVTSLGIGCSSGGSDSKKDSNPSGSSSSASSSSGTTSSSSSGSGGGSEPELAAAAIDTTQKTINMDSVNLPMAAVITTSNSAVMVFQDDLQALIESSAALATLPMGATTTESDTIAGDCGGSVSTTITVTTPDNGSPYPMHMIGDMQYNSYCINAGTIQATYDGTASYEATLTETLQTYDYYYDLLFSTDSAVIGSQRVVGNVRCVTEGSSAAECTTSSDYEGAGGTSYYLTDTSVSGNNSSGYTVSGTLASSTDITYQLSASGLTTCENGTFGTGTIDVTLNGQDYLSISFNSCTEMVVTYEGQTVIYDQ